MFQHCYRIVVRGIIGDAARQAFEGMETEQTGSDTVLRGKLDQAALFGALSRVQALGLELIEIMRESPEGEVTSRVDAGQRPLHHVGAG